MASRILFRSRIENAVEWDVVLPGSSIFRLRRRSLVRAVVLPLVALGASMRLAGFPDVSALHSSRWQMAAALGAVWGMAETARCLDRKWTLYHAGVLILLYADLMILGMVLFLWLFL